jgi:DNA polymerase (family X)
MPRGNEEIAGLLQEYAELLQITGGDPFRSRNYEKAAKSIAGYSGDAGQLDEAGLQKIPGVGKSIATKITESQQSGTFAQLDELRTKIPEGVRAMTKIPGLGPKRACQLYNDLGIASVDELADAIAEGQLRDLKGFGPKSEEKISRGIEFLRGLDQRAPINVAADLAERIIAVISAVGGCERCEYAGSLRRFRETVGDVDILAAAADSAPLMAAFVAMPEVQSVIASGDTKTSVRISTEHVGHSGSLQVDLRVIPADCWGAALQYFTGSQAHNVAVREIAVRKKLKLSEYGLFEAESGNLIASGTEQEIYAQLGMDWIPAPMRENNGEVQAAQRHEIPALVQLGDIRGDLHSHTNLTDGVASLEEMVTAARARGYAYFAVTDHAPNLFMQRMTIDKMLEQREQLRKLESEQLESEQRDDDTTPMVLLHGTELNIAPDGSVDWPEDILAGFDVCVASVHSSFDQPRAEMTRRFRIACENPQVNIIGHPTARRIGKRPGVDVDFAELFRACAETGTALEINSQPQRLDLPSDHLKAARDAGVKFAIDTDSHAVGALGLLKYGVGTAQRGWLTPDDIINAWPLERLRDFLGK